ncbi:MAG: PA2779 family protein [Vicinamibacterales bacterium]
MRTLRTLLVIPLVFMLSAPPLAAAQSRHAIDPSALSETVAGQVAQQDADRAAIREALNRPEVRELAAKSGIDLDRVQASVDTLGASSLSQVAAAAQQVNQALVGGASTIVISTTTIIIALLIVILIVVAVD